MAQERAIHRRRATGEQDGCQGLVLVRLREQVGPPCGLSPLHLAEAGVPGVQLPGCQEGALGVHGSGCTVVLPGTTWDLPPAPESKGIAAETGPLPSRGSKLDPDLGEADKRFPAGLQVTPARGGGPAGLLPCHELPPMATFRDGATAGLSPHRTVTHFSGAIPIPEMHREGNSGKGSCSLESLARSKAPRAGILLSVY